MTLDLEGASAPRVEELDVTPEGGRWAVRHGSGYLGLVSSEAEAWALVRTLRGSRLMRKSPPLQGGAMQPESGTYRQGSPLLP